MFQINYICSYKIRMINVCEVCVCVCVRFMHRRVLELRWSQNSQRLRLPWTATSTSMHKTNQRTSNHSFNEPNVCLRDWIMTAQFTLAGTQRAQRTHFLFHFIYLFAPLFSTCTFIILLVSLIFLFFLYIEIRWISWSCACSRRITNFWWIRMNRPMSHTHSIANEWKDSKKP